MEFRRRIDGELMKMCPLGLCYQMLQCINKLAVNYLLFLPVVFSYHIFNLTIGTKFAYRHPIYTLLNIFISKYTLFMVFLNILI